MQSLRPIMHARLSLAISGPSENLESSCTMVSQMRPKMYVQEKNVCRIPNFQPNFQTRDRSRLIQ